MSRHQYVKKLDTQDVMDEFDGGLDDEVDENGEELTADEKAQLEEGTAMVRSVLGPEFSASDKEIQDSLWHYYYDVDRTVNWLLQTKTPSTPSLKKNTPKKSKGAFLDFHRGLTPSILSFCPKHYFKDIPWLNVPPEMRADIHVEPLIPPGRLLGGMGENPPKQSKLAALAARRKKDAQSSSMNSSEQLNHSVVLLDKLSSKSPAGSTTPSGPSLIISDGRSGQDGQSTGPRILPAGRRKSPASKEKLMEPPAEDKLKEAMESCAMITASPSTFARTMFGSTLLRSEHLPAGSHSQNSFTATFPLRVDSAESRAFTGPSPDDIMANAQSASKGMKPKRPSKTSDKDSSVNGVANRLATTSVADSPRAKSKNLNVLAEYEKSERKNAANFVVIGHVDAGKSTLMGRLLLDLNVVDQRTLERYRKEALSMGKASFALAWFLDQDTEERNRGVTIDIAMNKFETEKTAFTVLDAPGHRDFIPNMIAGASQADFAVLVIDASTGSFESGLKGQTKEHALLVRSIGVSRIIIAVNKLDTVGWSKDRFTEISQQTSAFLLQAGFQAKNLTFIPCSGLSGDNVTRRSTEAAASWYDGPILLEALDTSDPVSRALASPLRSAIADVFRGGVQNPLSISGRIDAGSLQVGDQILVLPANEAAWIRGIEADDEPADWAVAGQNVVLHLTDIDPVHLKAGDVICPPTAPVRTVREFTIKALAFEHLTPMYVDLIKGRLNVQAKIEKMIAILDKGSGAVVKRKPKLVKPGEVVRVSLVVDGEAGVPLEAGARVALRAEGETVAAGLVE